jgi:hypothetical protein
MSNIKFIQKFHCGGHLFWDTVYFDVILPVTGLVTHLKHRVMVMIWKIFVGLTYHIVIFHADIMNFIVCAFFLLFYRVIDVSRQIFAILSKNIPPDHIFDHIYSSRQQKFIGDESLWCTHNDWTLYLVTWQLMDRYKVYVWSSANWNKKVALQMLILPDSQAHEKCIFLMHFQWLHFTSWLLTVFDSYYSFYRYFCYL